MEGNHVLNLIKRGPKPLTEETLTQHSTQYYSTIVNHSVNPLRQAWVDLLNQYNWDWFATLTFRSPPTTYTANNRLRRWLNTIQRKEKRNIGYYKGMEFTRSGVPHFHLLMGNLDGVRRDKYWEVWFRENGRARILPYDSKLGADYYLTKYVVKDEYSQVENWEIEGLECLGQLSLGLRREG